LNTSDFDTSWNLDFEARIRGLILGLALGESLGRARGALPHTGPIEAGIGTQLAAFTADGLIRAAHKSAAQHPEAVLWHAYLRWAVGQNIDAVTATKPWANYGNDFSDGWLAHVPALQQRRGSAPSTVAALAGARPGTVERPGTSSGGAHGLLRVLPAAALVMRLDREQLDRTVESFTALTHGADLWASSGAVAIAAQSLATGMDPRTALIEAGLAQMGTYIDRARWEADNDPRSVATLRAIAPRSTSENALSAAIYATCSYPGPDTVMEALHFAAAAPHGSSAAAVTGALLGAAHGFQAWPVELLARHELVWPLDTLATDLAHRICDDPTGSQDGAGNDARWWHRYPGH
jgi:ADP-ribosylglycohydrolase